MRRYPLEPVIELAAALGLSQVQLAELAGIDRRGMLRDGRLRGGVTVRNADRLASVIGLHPAEVWPSWFEDAIEDAGQPCAECGTVFLPNRAGHVYCRKVCSQVAAQRRRRRTPEGREQARAARRRFYASQPEYERRRRRAYYAANAEREKARQRAYYHAKRGVA